MKINVWVLVLVCTAFIQAPLYAKGDPAKGKILAAQGDGSGAPCATCHGAQGEGMAAIYHYSDRTGGPKRGVVALG